jgi:hypothetical protein
MSVKSFGNPGASFKYRFGGTGKRASRPVSPPPFQATGGTTVDSGGYRIHIFTTSSTPGFNITSLGTGVVEVLVVAGGAAGGGGGGGAGGVRNFPYTFTATGSYPITVGGGGTPGGSESPQVDAGDGNPSFISGPGGAIIFATGGGGGGMHDHAPSVGQTGGSGGGRAAIGPGFQPGASTVASPDGISPTVQGYPGGGAFQYDAGNGTSAGGGGAGAAGGNGTPPANGTGRVAGAGGIGIPISWMPPSYGTPGPQPGRYFAGGGGGAGWGNIGGPGGAGGGGAGGYSPVTPTSSGQAGSTNTGGGGGATSFPPYGVGGTGGSGIIAIRYQI